MLSLESLLAETSYKTSVQPCSRQQQHVAHIHASGTSDQSKHHCSTAIMGCSKHTVDCKSRSHLDGCKGGGDRPSRGAVVVA